MRVCLDLPNKLCISDELCSSTWNMLLLTASILELHSYRVPWNLHYLTIILFSRQYWEGLTDNSVWMKLLYCDTM